MKIDVFVHCRGREVIRAGSERAGGSEARRLPRKGRASRPAAWCLQGPSVPARPAVCRGEGARACAERLPAGLPCPRGQLGAELRSTLTTRHVRFPTDHFPLQFGVHSERKAQSLRADPCPHGGLPTTDTPADAACVARRGALGRIATAPSRVGPRDRGVHRPAARLRRSVLAALPSGTHTSWTQFHDSGKCAPPGGPRPGRPLGHPRPTLSTPHSSRSPHPPRPPPALCSRWSVPCSCPSPQGIPRSGDHSL